MNISSAGLDLIKSFEAYMKKLPDGGCMAYQEVLGRDKAGKPILDIPTIGFGVTEGVTMGMVWTREQAEDALHRELAKHEAIVQRLVTAEMTQGMFDALVSFNFNCGRLKGSTLLKKLNAGDMLGAASEFSRFSYAKGVQLPGLARRRAAEKMLFLSDVHADEPEHCPQQADEPKAKVKPEHAALGTGAGLVGAKAAVDNVSEFKALGASVSGFASKEMLIALAIGAAVFGFFEFVLPRLRKQA